MTMRLPEDVRRHLRAACKENLLAIRALLDVLIGQVEPAPARAPAPFRAGGQAASTSAAAASGVADSSAPPG
jgi:hypothetical protein